MRLGVDTTTLMQADDWILGGFSFQHWPRTILDENNAFIHFLDFIAGLVYLIHFGFAWIFTFCLYLYYRKKTSSG